MFWPLQGNRVKAYLHSFFPRHSASLPHADTTLHSRGMFCPSFASIGSRSFGKEARGGRVLAGTRDPRAKRCTRVGSQGSQSVRPPHAVVLFGLLRALPGETSSIATIAARIF